MEKKDVEVNEYYEFEEKYPPFLYAGMILLLLELMVRIFMSGVVV